MQENRIAVRARNILFIIPILVTIIILGVGQTLSVQIADDNAMRMSRQYAIEASANFQIFMNPHMRLMQQLSYSTAIARWLANETDAVAKAAAFEAMVGHTAAWPNAYFMFTSNATWSGYDFNVNLTLNEFVSWGQLSGGEASQWFFDTRDGQLPFILNIQRTRPQDDGSFYLYIWTNHRVYYREVFVGVVTIGSPFQDIMNATFYGFDIEGKRGYIIDQYGMVRMDSAGILETTVAGLPALPDVPEALTNPNLAEEINRHLQRMQGGFFPLGTLAQDSLRLDAGEYRYASISPIVGTNWSVIVLSGTDISFFALFQMRLMVAAILLVILVLLFGSFLLQRTVLRPIHVAMEKERIMYNSVSIPSTLWGMDGSLIDCNQAMTDFLGLASKEETIARYYEFTPEVQACGNRTEDICHKELEEIFKTGQGIRKRWLHKIGDEAVPVEVTMTRIPAGDSFVCVCYAVDLRPIEAAMAKEREAHEQAKIMLDNAPIGITMLDKNLSTINCNREAHDMFTIAETMDCEDMAVNMPIYQPDGRLSMDVFRENTRKAFETGFFRAELMCQKHDGTPLPTDSTWARVEYRGEIIVIEYSVNITRRKAAEARAREAYEQLQQVFDLSPTIVNVWNKDLKMIKTSKQAVEWYRVGSEQEYIDRFAELAPEFQPCGTPTAQRAIELVKEAFDKEAVTFEWMTNTADGEPLPIMVKLVRSGDDADAVVYAFTSDLREVKLLEAQIRESQLKTLERESQDYISAMFQASPMFIDVWDEDYQLIDCNDKVCDLLGVPNKEEFINNVYEKYNPQFQPCGKTSVEMFEEKLTIGLREGIVKYDWTHLDVHGNEVPVEVTYIRTSRQGKSVMVGYNYDLRELKKAEEERNRIEVVEESNRAKSAFLARMSHEIRTPITAVMGISEIEMQNTKNSPQTEDSFIKIHSAANSLLGIVNDILDLSKIEVGKMELTKDEYDVASLVVDNANIHLGFASSKNIKYSVTVDENLPTSLIGDALRIGQIINNILSNAFKYTLEGSVDLAFVCLPESDNADQMTLQITVRDSGLGMTTEQLSDLKNEYTRYHERNYQFIEGTGLGMPIVYNLAKMMDAQIDITSEVGIGTKVVVSIPQQVASEKVLGKDLTTNLEQFKELAVAKKFTFTPEPMPYGTVLVVDDVEANLYVAKGLLSFYGLTIETCSNGFDAVDKIKHGKVYDLVFMDYMMPGLNGTQAMRQMREAGYKHPIVALTANAMIGMVEEFMKEGFDGFVSKPIQTRQLNAVLTKFIRDKQPPEVIAAAIASQAEAQGDINSFQRDPALLAKLKEDFVKMHTNTMQEIRQSIQTGDLDTANRLAHTLKGAAGMLFEDSLAAIAKEVEQAFIAKKIPTDEQLLLLDKTLARVLDTMGDIPAPDTANITHINTADALALLDKLIPLLESKNVTCMEMLDDIRNIARAEDLYNQIEAFDFSQALQSAYEVKQTLGGNT